MQSLSLGAIFRPCNIYVVVGLGTILFLFCSYDTYCNISCGSGAAVGHLLVALSLQPMIVL